LATPAVAKKLFIWERKLIIELSDMSLFNGRLGSVMLEIGISTKLASLPDLVVNPWFQILSLLIGILGTGIAVITYLVSRKYKRLWYAVRSFTLVRRERATLPGLQVFFDRKLVEALTISKIVLWNSGKDTVRSNDFAEKNPLSFRAKKPLEILEAFVIQTTSSSCAANIVRRGNNCFAITFDFFDPRDGVVIQMAHTGTSSQDIDVVGRIVGGREIQRREPTGGVKKIRFLGAILPKTPRRARRFIMWFMGVAGVVLIALPFLLPLIASPRKNDTWLTKILVPVIGLSYLGLVFSVYRRRTPKGLERFDDEFGDSESGDDLDPVIPIAPQFATRSEAAEWIIKQARVLAQSAQFTVSKRAENEVELDFGSFWLTLDQLKQIWALGEKNGFKIRCKGRGKILAPDGEKGVRLIG
jgi:hypothetical protein